MSIKEEYFRKFPLMVYRGTPATNILKRVDFNSKVRNFFDAFYDHTMSEGDNPQSLSYDYYNDVDYDWLIYHTNDIIDPYYGVVMDNQQFEEVVKTKYGSIEQAKKNIFLYKTNHESSPDLLISPAEYNILTGGVKKYYEPVQSSFGVVSYKRSTVDLFASTNRIISVEFSTALETPFTQNEIVRNGSTYATVASSSTTTMILKHVAGDWDRDTVFNITGDKNNITAEIAAGSYTLLQQVIPEAEEVFYSPYSYYDYEADLNEQKRDIYLVGSSYAEKLNSQLTEIMK